MILLSTRRYSVVTLQQHGAQQILLTHHVRACTGGVERVVSIHDKCYILQASVVFFHAPSKAAAASSNHAAPVALARAPLVSPAIKLGLVGERDGELESDGELDGPVARRFHVADALPPAANGTVASTEARPLCPVLRAWVTDCVFSVPRNTTNATTHCRPKSVTRVWPHLGRRGPLVGGTSIH